MSSMDPSPNSFTPSVLTVESCCTKITQLLESAHLHYGHGASNAQSEALWIVSNQLGISPTKALDLGDKPLSAKMIQDAINIAQQRISRREPLAYLLGEAWLMGIPFDCTTKHHSAFLHCRAYCPWRTRSLVTSRWQGSGFVYW